MSISEHQQSGNAESVTDDRVMKRELASAAIKTMSRTDRREQLSPTEKVISSARQVIREQITTARQNQLDDGGVPLGGDVIVHAAFVAQNQRLQNEDMDDWPTSQLTSEKLALAVLFSPMAQNAAKTGNKWQLSRFNSMIADWASSASPTIINDLPSILKNEITGFNKSLGKSDSIAGSVEQCMRGVQAEIAVARAVKHDETIDTTIPDTYEDLRGKDISFSRDGITVHADVKRHASFDHRVQDMTTEGYITQEQAKYLMTYRYGFVQYDRDGSSLYLMDADAAGSINGLEYSLDGQEYIAELANRMLEETKLALAN